MSIAGQSALLTFCHHFGSTSNNGRHPNSPVGPVRANKRPCMNRTGANEATTRGDSMSTPSSPSTELLA
jgi:hypothetical protein